MVVILICWIITGVCFVINLLLINASSVGFPCAIFSAVMFLICTATVIGKFYNGE
jgi:hypothetical protein